MKSSDTLQDALSELRIMENGLWNLMSLLDTARKGGMGAQLYAERAYAGVFAIRNCLWRARANIEAVTKPGAESGGA